MKKQAILRCWAEIDHQALRSNLKKIRERIPKSTQVMGIVKANAYGHGAVPIAKTLKKSGIRWFGVASSCEALFLHEHGIRGSFLILGSALPEEYEVIVRQKFVPTISSFLEAKRFNEMARHLRQKVSIHFKIDTGMGRLGSWWEEAERDLMRVTQLSHLKVTGIYTHFASADSDDALTREQVRRFLQYIPWFKGKLIHASNSAGFFGENRIALDCVRPGISLYGYSPISQKQKLFKPVMTWKTRITAIHPVSVGRTLSYGATYRVTRDSRIAVLAAGYADGYPRLLSNRGEVLVRGKRVPIRGRVTMDQILVDISKVPDAREGDEVVLMGISGKKTILASELAEMTGTIPYEILCGISERVSRIHLNYR
ncbi:MAG: alanine racemase [Verrucomicrobiota bacterium]